MTQTKAQPLNLSKSTWQLFYSLTKPGIIRGNLIMAVAGFGLAANGQLWPGRLLALAVGTSFIIGASCIINNYTDREIDRQMERTKHRALATGQVSSTQALGLAASLTIVGSLVLYRFTNPLTLAIGLAGMLIYVAPYAVVKRRSSLGTLVGSFAGATPPLAGYCAVTNHIDRAGLVLFAAMICWQMPHFYAIAIFRSQDYGAAGIPVLPLKRGVTRTQWAMLGYAIAFGLAANLLTVFHYTGYIYSIAISLVSLWWIWITAQAFRTTQINRWAKQVFGSSLIVLMLFALLLALNFVLP